MSGNPKTWTVKTIFIISQALTLLAVGLVVLLSSNARSYNCDQITKALDAYTQGLLNASEPPATPAEQVEQDEALAKFRATYEPILDDCK
jgi:hypothetical protein